MLATFAVVAGLLATVVVEEAAREQLEARYRGGQSSLLPEAHAASDHFGEMVDRMWSMAEQLVPTTKSEQRRIAKDGDRLYQERVAQRVQTLIDNARGSRRSIGSARISGRFRFSSVVSPAAESVRLGSPTNRV